MSKSIRTERDRRIAELEALVSGQATEIDRLTKALEDCESEVIKLLQALGKAMPPRKLIK